MGGNRGATGSFKNRSSPAQTLRVSAMAAMNSSVTPLDFDVSPLLLEDAVVAVQRVKTDSPDLAPDWASK